MGKFAGLLLRVGVVLLLPGLMAQALAGGWVSSGGEIFQLGKNPWFVKGSKGGVTDVSYCVQVDAASMSASDATVKASIQAAFAYWKAEFAQNGGGGGAHPGFAALATQNFHIQPGCDDQTDIRFLIGFGTLSAKEVTALDDPRKYVGVTVRTDYDFVQLHGKGFVYISGDRGDKAYHNPGDLIEHAWENEKLLRLALIHEVGHIMGIPHTGTGLMSEVFPEQLVNKRFSQFYLDNPIPSFLNPPLNFEICSLNGSFSPEFFKITGPVACLAVAGAHDVNGEIRLDLSTRETEGSPLKPLGSIRAELGQTSALGAHPSVVIHLPQEQAVFSVEERLLNGFMLGPIYQEGSAKGAFRLANTIDPCELQIELHPDSISMVGVVDGRPMPVLVYSPPSLLKMLFPINGVQSRK